MQTASYQAIDKKGSLRIHHNDQNLTGIAVEKLVEPRIYTT